MPARIWAWILLPLLIGSIGVVYATLLPLSNSDLDYWYTRWVISLRSAGLSATVHSPEFDYQPIYLVLLQSIDWLSPVEAPIVTVKLAALAGLATLLPLPFLMARERSPLPASVAIALTLCLVPSVVANTALWGQADILYASPLLWAIYLGASGRLGLALVPFGLALTIKLQAIFLAPLFVFAVLRRPASLRYVPLIIVGFVPAMLASLASGTGLLRVAGVYIDQFNYFHRLSMNAPNIWEVLGRLVDPLYGPGVVVGLSLGIGLSLYIAGLALAPVHADRSAQWREKLYWLVALLAAIGIPFLLPKMHDRYFFVADILTLLALIKYRTYLFGACFALMQSGSLLAYLAFHGATPLAGWGPFAGAFCTGGALLLVMHMILRLLAGDAAAHPLLQHPDRPS